MKQNLLTHLMRLAILFLLVFSCCGVGTAESGPGLDGADAKPALSQSIGAESSSSKLAQRLTDWGIPSPQLTSDLATAGDDLINFFADKGRDGLKAWKAVFDSGLDDALRKNVDALENISNSLDEGLDAIDAVEDAIQTLNKTKWEEIKAFFKRGNDFNRKARDEAWYDFNEVHLENGKRLDGYDHDIGEIVSRKATDFDNIQPATFEKYLKEIDNKYAPGTVIRSNKYPEIDGQALHGTKIIEVPISNQSSPNLSTFQALADQYNTIIRFRPE